MSIRSSVVVGGLLLVGWALPLDGLSQNKMAEVPYEDMMIPDLEELPEQPQAGAPVTEPAGVPAIPADATTGLRPLAPGFVEPVTATGPARKVVVLDLRSSEMTAAIARALTVVITAEVDAAPGYKAVSRNDLQSLLTHQSEAQLLGCAEVQCMADIAKLAAADLLIAGSVEKLEASHLFSLELIDPSIPQVLERQTASWRDSPDRMVELARPYVDRLLAGGRAQHFEGALEVIAPAGARVVVDDNDVGQAPLPTLVRNLSTGVHTVNVSQDGYLPYVGDAVVVRGETTLVRAELIDEASARPWYARWWVWGSVGGGLALVGGTAAVLAVALLSEPDPTTLDVLMQLPLGQ